MKQLLLLLVLAPTVVATATPNTCFRQQPQANKAQEKCLAVTIYGEARGESEQGQIAVAYTVKNRAKNTSLCNVALAPKQYSIFTNNPELRAIAVNEKSEPVQYNVIDSANWKKAKYIAKMVMAGHIPDPTLGSTHYLADKLMKQKKYKYPRWSKEFAQVVVIGNHRFFKYNNKSAINKA